MVDDCSCVLKIHFVQSLQGTDDAKVNENPELGGLLKKNHEISVRMHTSVVQNRELVYVQDSKHRVPKISVVPSFTTRWESEFE